MSTETTVTEGARASLLRSSAVMALGTVVSRVTGFMRTAVIAYALGTGLLGDAFNVSNTIPNTIHDLVLLGVLTSVILPMIVRASKQDSDGGLAYTQRLYTLLLVGLLGVTVLAMLLVKPIVGLYLRNPTPAQFHVAVLFGLYFFPQIFFYGINAYQAAVLNTRGRFGAPMWTPVLNNLVIVAVGITFWMITRGQSVTVASVSDAQVTLVGIGTTVALVVQTAAVVPSMRAAGFRWRLRFDFKNLHLGEMARMGGWTLGYVVATQIGFLVTTKLASGAGAAAHREGLNFGAGYTPYANAYQIFQLPYAIIAVSIITALLPRMSDHAADARADLVRDDFSTGIRVSSVVLVPAAYGMLVFGEPVGILLFNHGHVNGPSADFLGHVIQVFALGIVPFSIFQLLLRVFYAYKDTKTPALISGVTIAFGVAINVTAALVLPTRLVVLGLAVGFWLPYVLGAVIGWRVMSRRLGGLDGHRSLRTLVRLHLAGLPALVFGVAMLLAFTQTFGTNVVTSVLSIVVGGGVGALLYLLFARKFGAEEVTTLLGMVRGRLRGRTSE